MTTTLWLPTVPSLMELPSAPAPGYILRGQSHFHSDFLFNYFPFWLRGDAQAATPAGAYTPPQERKKETLSRRVRQKTTLKPTAVASVASRGVTRRGAGGHARRSIYPAAGAKEGNVEFFRLARHELFLQGGWALWPCPPVKKVK